MKELFQPVITTTSNLINDLSTSKVTPNLVQRMAGTLFPREDTIPIHKNSTLIQQPGVRETTNRYIIGTNIKKGFDRIFYRGKIISNNSKWYKVRYNDGNEEELIHRQTTLIIEYNPIPFTAGFGPDLSAIIRKTETLSNITFKDLSIIQDITFSVTHLVTGKERE